MKMRDIVLETTEADELLNILTDERRKLDFETYGQMDYNRTNAFLRTHPLSEISDKLILVINNRYLNLIYRKWMKEKATLSDELIIKLIKQHPGEFEIMMNDVKLIPSEAVQQVAVKKLGKAIYYIIDKGIIPSEAVQQIAVKAFGYPIKYIVAGGISPSDAVIQLAINKDPDLIRSVPNATIEHVQTALTHPKLINNEKLFNRVVKMFFSGNELMQRKWFRYGEKQRNQ